MAGLSERNDDRIVFGNALHQCVGRDLIVVDRRCPALRSKLRADDCIVAQFTAFFEDLKQDFDFTYICNRMRREVVQYIIVIVGQESMRKR